MSGLISLSGGVNSGVLVAPGGTPIVPQWLQQEVYQATSRRGKIEWMDGAFVAYYALKVRWRESDPRWQHVREGHMPESAAFDLEQVFPKEFSTQDIASYIRANYGERAAAPDQAEKVAEAAVRSQQDATNANIDRFTQESVEQSARESSHAKRVRAGAESAHPMVSGGLSR